VQAVLVAMVFVLAVSSMARAATTATPSDPPSLDPSSLDPSLLLALKSLPEVITGIRNWVIGILASIATLFLVLAGVYWATAGGDPAQVDKAKGALRNALIGYGLAILAPVLLQVVQGIVGG
jgi:hypothetical protein